MIVERTYNFRRALDKRTTTNKIVVHHAYSNGDVSAATVHQWHLDRHTNGVYWTGIGYHFVVRYDGMIERGRPEDTIGAHAGAGHNWDSIGICLAGNFMVNNPTEKQITSLVWLLKYLTKKYGNVSIIGHDKTMATDCPGKKFPWPKVMNMFKQPEKEVEKVSGKFKDVSNNHWGKEAAEALGAIGIINGKAEGKFAPNDTLTRIELAVIIHRVLLKLGAIDSQAIKENLGVHSLPEEEIQENPTI